MDGPALHIAVMQIHFLIAYLSTSIWVILPFFQWKNKFFIFYSLLSFLGLTGLIYSSFGSGNNDFFIPISLLTIAATDNTFFKKNKYVLIFTGVIIYLATTELDYKFQYIITAIINFTIALLFIRSLAHKLFNEFILDIYLLLLTLYEISIALKLIAIITDFQTGIAQYDFTTLFQILLGIIFMFTNETRKWIYVKISPPKVED